MRFYTWIFLLFLAAPVASSGQTIELSLPDTSGVVGDTLLVPVNASQAFDSLGIESIELNFSFKHTSVNIISVQTDGAALSQFGSVQNNSPSVGVLLVASAGSEPLQGDDPLLFLEVVLLRQGTFTLGFGNEKNNIFTDSGQSLDLALLSGTFSVRDLPSFSITPRSKTIVKGDSLQFSTVSSAEEPISWRVSPDSVATINEDGMLYATGYGRVKITATDNRGIEAVSGTITIRPFRLTTEDQELFQGNRFTVSVQTGTLDGLNVSSGSFNIVSQSFRDQITGITAETDGTLLEGVDIVHSIDDQTLRIAFAGSESIEGSGELIRLTFDTIASQQGARTWEFNDILFNSDLTGVGGNFIVDIKQLPNVTVSGAQNSAFAGDSIQFEASNTTGSLIWRLSKTEIGSIDENGIFKTVKGGRTRVIVTDSIGASGRTETITIYDAEIGIGDTEAAAGEQFLIPVRVTNMDRTPRSFSAAEGVIDLQGMIKEPDIDLSGTLAEGWSASTARDGNLLRFAIAGVDDVNRDGILFYISGEFAEDKPSESRDLAFDNIIVNEGSFLVRGNSGTLSEVERDFTINSRQQINATEGGTVNEPETGATAEISAGTLAYDIQIESGVYKEIPDGADVSGVLVYFGPQGTSFSDSVTITVPYDPANLPEGVTNEADLNLVRYDAASESWVELPSTVDTENSLVIGKTLHFSGFGAGKVDVESEPLSQVTLVTPENGATGIVVRPVFNWSESQNATSYQLQLSLESDFSTMVTDSSGITGTAYAAETDLESITDYYWRVRAQNNESVSDWSDVFTFRTEMTTSVEGENGIPARFFLEQNYPNPFNPSTVIEFGLPNSSAVRLEVYDLIGQRVAVLVDEQKASGTHRVEFNASSLSSGTYMYRIQTDEFTRVRKMTLIK